MANIQKDLIGKHVLTGGNNYYFSLPTAPANSALPNQLANQVLEEVYISVDSSAGAVNVYLPEISTFNGVWNAKVYVIVLDTTNAVTIYPTSSEGNVNTLNGAASVAASNPYDAWYFHIVRGNMWMALKCAGPTL